MILTEFYREGNQIMLDINRKKEFLTVPESEVLYYMTIYGHISGIAPQVSFRRIRTQDSEPRKYKRKGVKCPYCATKFSDVDADTKIDVSTNPDLRPTPSLFYYKCNHCNNEIGISIVHKA